MSYFLIFFIVVCVTLKSTSTLHLNLSKLFEHFLYRFELLPFSFLKHVVCVKLDELHLQVQASCASGYFNFIVIFSYKVVRYGFQGFASSKVQPLCSCE